MRLGMPGHWQAHGMMKLLYSWVYCVKLCELPFVFDSGLDCFYHFSGPTGATVVLLGSGVIATDYLTHDKGT